MVGRFSPGIEFMPTRSPRLEWGAQFRTNIKIIDEQHQVLFDLINDIDDQLLKDPIDACQLHKAIDGVVAYSLYHFVTEESLAYRAKATAQMDGHVRTHNEFRKKLAEYRRAAQDGDIVAVATDLLRYLKHWLVNHIMQTDVALGAEILAQENRQQREPSECPSCDVLHIAVAEGDADLREEIIFFLTHVGHRAVGCANGAALNKHMAASGSDVLIIDLGLPDIDGLDLLDRYGGRPDVAIVMLTAHGDTEDRIAGYQRGADAYLAKPVDMRELVAVVDHVAQRLYPPAASAAHAWRYSASRWVLVSPEDIAVTLTEQQAEMVQLFARAGRRVLTRKEIIQAMGWENGPAHNSHNDERIESCLSRLRHKLDEVGFNPTPIKTIRGVGYAFRAPLVEVS
jgi:hemerythrin-like metal-binding protein